MDSGVGVGSGGSCSVVLAGAEDIFVGRSGLLVRVDRVVSPWRLASALVSRWVVDGSSAHISFYSDASLPRSLSVVGQPSGRNDWLFLGRVGDSGLVQSLRIQAGSSLL